MFQVLFHVLFHVLFQVFVLRSSQNGVRVATTTLLLCPRSSRVARYSDYDPVLLANAQAKKNALPDAVEVDVEPSAGLWPDDVYAGSDGQAD